MSACPTLTTERLTLRPLRADDLEPFFESQPVVDHVVTVEGFGR